LSRAPSVDLYQDLLGLLEQVPEGMVTTPHELAVALGDPVAVTAVAWALKREDFKKFSKTVTILGSDAPVFSDFVSDGLLKRLAGLQREMAKRVIREDDFTEAMRLAGADAAYRGDEACATCVVMDGDLGLLETASASEPVRFPYIPGYLMFREAPVIEAAARLVSGFDLLFVNGHGVAHPRGCGLASCVGLTLDAPTIGVAERPLVGNVGERRGRWAPLTYDGEVVGAEVDGGGSRVCVSVGHRISLETSVEMVLKTVSGGRFPEPLRRAHMEASTMVKRER
jgi:deoxyribonuclease V